MEITVGMTLAVPKQRWETDPDAEHTSLMNDMKYIIEADRLGFKYGLIAEHHFLHEYSHTSAPEVELGYLARATERIHLMSGIFNPLPTVNHPVKVAEKVAMLDHLTESRFEFGTGRGAGSYEILGFLPGTEDMNATKAIWDDVIDEIPKMWMNEVYPGYESEHWSIPARPVNPKPWRHGHPALWYAAANPTSWTTFPSSTRIPSTEPPGPGTGSKASPLPPDHTGSGRSTSPSPGPRSGNLLPAW